MNTLKKAELTHSVYDTERFSKSGIPIYNSEVPGTAGRKTRKRRKSRTEEIVKRHEFQANARRRVRI